MKFKALYKRNFGLQFWDNQITGCLKTNLKKGCSQTYHHHQEEGLTISGEIPKKRL